MDARTGAEPCLSYLKRPYAVIRSCLIYYHLWQELSIGEHEGGGSIHQGDHAIAVDSAVHLPIHWQHWGRPTGLADVAAAPLPRSVRHEQGAPSALVVAKDAVLVVGELSLRPNISSSASEAEKTCSAAPPCRKQGAANAEW